MLALRSVNRLHMVNLIGFLDIVDYDVGPCINVAVAKSLPVGLNGIVCMKELAPSDTLMDFWNHTAHSDTEWQVFIQVYQAQLETSKCKRAIQMIANLDEIFHRVNVIFNDYEFDGSIRSLFVSVLDELEVQVLER